MNDIWVNEFAVVFGFLNIRLLWPLRSVKALPLVLSLLLVSIEPVLPPGSVLLIPILPDDVMRSLSPTLWVWKDKAPSGISIIDLPAVLPLPISVWERENETAASLCACATIFNDR